MANREQINRVDAQWQCAQSAWGPKDNEGERKMLYDLLEPGEDVELLQACSFETKNVVWASRHDRGVVVGTGRRVILLNRGRLSKNRFDLRYLEIDEVTEPEPGRVRVSGSGPVAESPAFDLSLQFGAAEFSRFVRGHLLSDEASVAAAFPHVLEAGEQVQHWAHCSAGQETVFHSPGSGGPQGGVPEYWGTLWDDSPALAVTTERRVLLIDARNEEVIASCAHATIQAVEYMDNTEGQEVRFVNQRREVYAAHFLREADASPFVSIMRDHSSAAAQQAPWQTRILAGWRLQHPIWGYRDDHENERNKLSEILDNGEHLEALLWGTYRPRQGSGDSHNGVIAATDRRLLFVSNSWDDKHISELPLHGVASVSRDGGELRIDASPEYGGYEINGLDDMSRHDSREKGQVEVFAARLRSLAANPPHYTAAPESSSQPDGSAANTERPLEAKLRRVTRQWRERSDDWDASQFKNEMSMLCKILADDEDIERLIEGYYKEDVQGAVESWGVIAATDRRVVYVYNGMSGPNAAELPYGAIGSVHMKKGLIDCRIMIAAGGAGNDWVITNVDNESGRRFTDCVQGLAANPPSLPEAPDSLLGGDFQEAMAKRQRVAQQWQERSNGWEPSLFKNEQEKLCEILDDGEDIECLLHGYWKEDIEGMESQWGVIAATLRRLIYVYNGRDGLRLAELPYEVIRSVRCKKGLIDCRITIAAGDHLGWEITSVSNKEGGRFVGRVQGHTQFNAVKA